MEWFSLWDWVVCIFGSPEYSPLHRDHLKIRHPRLSQIRSATPSAVRMTGTLYQIYQLLIVNLFPLPFPLLISQLTQVSLVNCLILYFLVLAMSCIPLICQKTPRKSVPTWTIKVYTLCSADQCPSTTLLGPSTLRNAGPTSHSFSKHHCSEKPYSSNPSSCR